MLKKTILVMLVLFLLINTAYAKCLSVQYELSNTALEEVPEGQEQSAYEKFLEKYYPDQKETLLQVYNQASRAEKTQMLNEVRRLKMIYLLNQRLDNKNSWLGLIQAMNDYQLDARVLKTIFEQLTNSNMPLNEKREILNFLETQLQKSALNKNLLITAKELRVAIREQLEQKEQERLKQEKLVKRERIKQNARLTEQDRPREENLPNNIIDQFRKALKIHEGNFEELLPLIEVVLGGKVQVKKLGEEPRPLLPVDFNELKTLQSVLEWINYMTTPGAKQAGTAIKIDGKALTEDQAKDLKEKLYELYFKLAQVNKLFAQLDNLFLPEQFYTKGSTERTLAEQELITARKALYYNLAQKLLSKTGKTILSEQEQDELFDSFEADMRRQFLALPKKLAYLNKIEQYKNELNLERQRLELKLREIKELLESGVLTPAQIANLKTEAEKAIEIARTTIIELFGGILEKSVLNYQSFLTEQNKRLEQLKDLENLLLSEEKRVEITPIKPSSSIKSKLSPSTQARIKKRLTNLEGLISVDQQTKTKLKSKLEQLVAILETETDLTLKTKAYNDLNYLLSELFIYDQLEKVTKPSLKTTATLEDLVTVLTDYHRDKIPKSAVEPKLEELLSEPEQTNELIEKTIRPLTFVSTSFPHPVAVRIIFGQTFITSLMEGENMKFLLTSTDLTISNLLKDYEVFDSEGKLNEENAKEAIKMLLLTKNSNVKKIDNKVNTILELWKTYLETRSSADLEKLQDKISVSKEVLEGDFGELDLIKDLDSSYSISHTNIEGLTGLIQGIRQSDVESAAIELEAPGNARRVGEAINKIKQGLLIESDGLYEEIEQELPDGSIKTVSGKKLTPDQYKKVKFLNKYNKEVDVKVLLRLHITPKYQSIMSAEEMADLKLMSEQLPDDSTLNKLSNTDLKNKIEQNVLIIEPLIKSIGSRYKEAETNLNILKSFISNVDNDLEVTSEKRTEVIRILKELKKLHDALLRNRNIIASGFEYVDGFIAVADATKQLWTSSFPELAPNKVFVILNESPFALYDKTHEQKAEAKKTFLTKLGVKDPESKTVLSFVGRLEDNKKYHTIEAVLRNLAKRSDRSNFVFIIGTDGTGARTQEFIQFLTSTEEGKLLVKEGIIKIVTDLTKFSEVIKKKSSPNSINKNLELLVNQYSNVLKPRFENVPEGVHIVETENPVQVISDIYIHPAKLEALGLSVQEADISRNYIIASQVGGIPQVVDKQQDFLIHNIDDGEGNVKIENWEEVLYDFAGKFAGSKFVVKIGEETFNFESASISNIIDFFSRKDLIGKQFELDGLTYIIGQEMFNVEKHFKDSRTALDIEAENILSQIINFKNKIQKGQLKKSVAPENNLLSLTREEISEILRKTPEKKMEAPIRIFEPVATTEAENACKVTV